jgi:hypothetical protein
MNMTTLTKHELPNTVLPPDPEVVENYGVYEYDLCLHGVIDEFAVGLVPIKTARVLMKFEQKHLEHLYFKVLDDGIERDGNEGRFQFPVWDFQYAAPAFNFSGVRVDKGFGARVFDRLGNPYFDYTDSLTERARTNPYNADRLFVGLEGDYFNVLGEDDDIDDSVEVGLLKARWTSPGSMNFTVSTDGGFNPSLLNIELDQDGLNLITGKVFYDGQPATRASACMDWGIKPTISLEMVRI